MTVASTVFRCDGCTAEFTRTHTTIEIPKIRISVHTTKDLHFCRADCLRRWLEEKHLIEPKEKSK
jgi:hypothetical protein